MASSRLSFAAAAAVLCWSALGANVHPGLNEVKRVYLMPMSSGLDQYMANRLTRVGRFEVVTDPALADAVFTDRLGPAFEDKWKQMYPPPEPVVEKTLDDKSTAAKPAEPSMIDGMTGAPVARISSFARGRGNVFLVSRKDGAVLWSHFQPPKNARVKELDGTADDIVGRLHRDLKVSK